MIRTHDLAFSAAPKTGSTWVREVMREARGGYTDCTGAKHDPCLCDTCQDLPRLTIVRHPFEWLPSVYTYATRKMPRVYRILPGPAGELPFKSGQGFVDAIEAIIRNPGIVGRVFEAFTGSADYVLQNETLRTDLTRALHDLKIHDMAWQARIYPPKNITTGGPYGANEKPEIPAELQQALLHSEADFIQTYWPCVPGGRREAALVG